MNMNLPYKGSNLTNGRCGLFINKKQKKLLDWLKVAKRSLRSIPEKHSNEVKLTKVYREHRKVEVNKS